MTKQPEAASWAVRALRGYARALRGMTRLQDTIQAFADGFLPRALRRDEKMQLTLAIYQERGQRETRPRALFGWERAWFIEQLPPAPARVLLAAAGNGAEATWLSARGYEVHAFEPAAACLPQLQAAVGLGGSAHCGSFEQLVAALTRRRGGAPHPLGALVALRYQAVLLGWSSFSHMLETEAQLELLRALAELCPDGPVLLSFYAVDDDDPELANRARRFGERLGARAARTRALFMPSAREHFFAHTGFVHVFTPAELRALASALGRQLSFDARDFPHAVLRR